MERVNEVSYPAEDRDTCDITVTAADEIIAALVAGGVDTFFGVPGGPAMPLFDAVLRHPAARLVESRHETTAVFSAMGYWAQCGRVPGVLVTAGPGGTNVVTGMAAAFYERVPVVVLCGDVAWATTGSRHLQEMGPEGVDIETMTRSVSRAALRLPSALAAAGYARRALAVASKVGQQGPVLLVTPLDRASATASHSPVVMAPAHGAGVLPTAERIVIDDVAHRLAAARRPLVVVGAACRQAAGDVQAMAEALRVPFVTTPRGKGVLDERHPLSLRSGGMAASWWARRYTAAGVDVALVLGTDLDDVSIGPTRYIAPGGDLIHVDLDARVFGRGLPTSQGIVADLDAFAADLAATSREHRIANALGIGARAQAVEASPFDQAEFAVDSSYPVAPHRALYDLQQAAGPCARFVTDIGEHMLFALHYLTASGPDSFGIHLGLGSMTSGIGSAVGRALADPTTRVVCVCGDGGMQMAGSELLVARQHNLPVLAAVFNDSRYNMVYHGYRQQFDRTAPWASPDVDFSLWAQSYGIPSAVIERSGQITAELVDKLMAHGGPALLDIRHDPDVRIKGAGRVEALQHMSVATSQ
ncbi:thiamine pyrophosphate-binding protein [Streptomyces sp. NPDC053431]|uniref:thiamine pyrophosphate-binding protein n=1 Tax=Streptomyces sp. NPDC053431 TaxID=3365703 RepID=UPI0037D89ADC